MRGRGVETAFGKLLRSDGGLAKDPAAPPAQVVSVGGRLVSRPSVS
jgi:hypothetical protein